MHEVGSCPAELGVILRITPVYRSSALLLLNTIVGLLLFNVCLAGLFWIIDTIGDIPRSSRAAQTTFGGALFNADGSPVDNGKRSAYQLEWFDFSGYGLDDQRLASEVLDDFYELTFEGMAYQPWVLFSEPPFHGRRVTVEVDPQGFPRRRTVNLPNPRGFPEITILVLGGSTTFGYNVSDEQTWPSYLAAILNERARQSNLNIHVTVLNYGRGYYYPSQETVLLLDLIRAGHRPSAVLFLDGVNWGESGDIPNLYRRAEQQFRRLQFAEGVNWPQVVGSVGDKIPMIRLAQAIARRLAPPAQRSVAQQVAAEGEISVDHIVNSFGQNRVLASAICRSYGIAPYFFLQPHALYNYAPGLYRRPLPHDAIVWAGQVQRVYPRLEAESGFINLTGLFERWGKDKKAIIDELHYSPTFHRFLAEHIADHLELKSLKPRVTSLDQTIATGLPRELNQTH